MSQTRALLRMRRFRSSGKRKRQEIRRLWQSDQEKATKLMIWISI